MGEMPEAKAGLFYPCFTFFIIRAKSDRKKLSDSLRKKSGSCLIRGLRPLDLLPKHWKGGGYLLLIFI